AGNRTDWRVPFRVENHSATGVAEQKDERTPRRFTISRPYPNPFNERTVVFGEASGGHRVQVSVFDARGRLVEQTRLVPRGSRFRWVWAARDLPSGVYLARFSCGPERRLVKLLLLR
ncbi:MAG TPA: T9SS type A sorting domain-containing protein, partial [Bacteroidetes bacterium]|nr:T9SS type A sorting domain-containing protein [Bacteroidota bacterium]